MRKPGGSRDLILLAAEAVVLDQGAVNLTLDSVAARAGVSKGGLLYHFRTKEALLQAMAQRLCSSFEEGTRERNGPGGTLAGYVSASVDREARGSVASALLAAIANDTKLLDPMREHLRRWVTQLRPGTGSFADRGIVWLATEGLWLLELVGLSPLNRSQRGEIAARLLELARRGEFGPDAPPRQLDGARRARRGPRRHGLRRPRR